MHTYMYPCMLALYMTALYPIICWSYIFLYAGLTYSYVSVLYTLICPCYILLYANCQPFHTLLCRPYILLYAGVFSVIWWYIGEGDIVIHEFTLLILFEWPIKTPFYFYCWIHLILRLSIYDYG
jgi:hypothetical protein